MKLLLVYPIHKSKEDVPPFELMQAVPSLKSKHDVFFLDQNSSEISSDMIAESARKIQPDAVVCLGRSIKAYSAVKDVALKIKHETDCAIIAAGDISRANKTLLKRASINRVIGSIKGASLLASALEYATTGNNVNPDELPFPDYGLINMEHYLHKLQKDSNGIKSIEIFASTGCAEKCAFCANRCTGVSRHSVDYVIRHINFLQENYGIGFIDFGDPCFTSDRQWLEEFMPKVKSLGISFRVYGARADQVDRDLLHRLHEAGCKSIYFGFESGSQKILDAIGKGITVEQNIKALLWATESGMHSPVQIVLGLPGESGETASLTALLLKNQGIPVEKEKVRCLLPQPGTPVYNHYKSEGLIGDEEEYLLKVSGIDTRNRWTDRFDSLYAAFANAYGGI